MTTGFLPPTLQLSFLPARLETRTNLIQGDFSSSSVSDVDPGPQMDCEGCVGISNAFCVANDDVSAFTARINSRRRLRKRYNRSVKCEVNHALFSHILTTGVLVECCTKKH